MAIAYKDTPIIALLPAKRQRQLLLRTLATVMLLVAFAFPAAAQPVVSAVLNGASYSATISPGCWVAIFGSNLATAPASATGLPLPPRLGGVSVSVAGLPASLLYVSPNQINALIPFEVTIPPDTVVSVVVTSSAGTSSPYEIRLIRNAPALFTLNGAGTGKALMFDSEFQATGTVEEQDVVILYAAGLGPTRLSGGLSQVVDDVEVYIGERRAEVLYAGLAPGLPGIYQLNVIAARPATDRVYLRSGGWQSNVVYASIRGGENTASVSGTIDGLFPSADPAFPSTPIPPCLEDDTPAPCGGGEPLSIMLHAGLFTVSFDILPSAGPFDVAAVGEAGGTIITINPVTQTYEASVTTVTAAVRQAQFSATFTPLWDYMLCDFSARCLPLPNNSVPANRLSHFWGRAIEVLPASTTTTAAGPNALLHAAGSLTRLRFTVDDLNNSALSKFGGLVQVPYGPFATRISTFKLYVDGRLIASKELPYAVVHRFSVSP